MTSLPSEGAHDHVPAPAANHVILFAGAAGSGAAAAVCSISDVVTLESDAEPLAVGLDYGEILVGVDDALTLVCLEGDQALLPRSELAAQAEGLVLFVAADTPSTIDVALLELDHYAGLVHRGSVVVAVTRSHGADPRFASELMDALIERFPAARIPLFMVDPWKRDQLGTVLLTIVAGAESHAILGTDISA